MIRHDDIFLYTHIRIMLRDSIYRIFHLFSSISQLRICRAINDRLYNAGQQAFPLIRANGNEISTISAVIII